MTSTPSIQELTTLNHFGLQFEVVQGQLVAQFVARTISEMSMNWVETQLN